MFTQFTEEDKEIPDLHLSLVLGSSAVETQTPHIRPEEVGPEEPTHSFSSEMCLSRTKLDHIPGSVLKNSMLKHLYLAGNQICSLPDSMFSSLPCLLWLDLRNNQIASLPAEIGSHRCLKTLLLEGNPISELPPELGNVISLKGLNLRNCPLRVPPQEIVHQGLQCILRYLRGVLAQRPVSMTKTPPELPVVEKLQLSELLEPGVEEQDESEDEDELQRFEELKHRMILQEKAEEPRDGKAKLGPLPNIRRSKAATKAGIIPGHRSLDSQQWKRSEERRPAAMKELKAVLIQRKKTKKTDLKLGVGNRNDRTQRQAMSMAECEESVRRRPECEEEARSARRLQRQIRAHVEKMQERRRVPRVTATEHITVEDEDLEQIRKLQTQLLEKSHGRGVKMNIYTGDTWLSFLHK